MNIFEKSRFAVFSKRQHPFAHDVSEFFYSNPAVPGISNLSDMLTYIVAVLYPKYIGTFATPAALPGVASANDYAVVTDDGDGKSAGYVYSVIDGATAWVKRYDVDWSVENIFAETVNRTQYMYVHKYGFDDHDAVGVPLAGIYAGQTIFGGYSAGTNLTFNANSNDGAGFVQTDNTFRPTTNNALDLGTATEKWRTGYFGTSALVNTLTLSTGSITDSTGAISFGNEDLTTTGNITGATGYFSSSLEVGPLAGNALILGAGSITDESGAISFGNENLTTTGTLASGTITVSADLVLSTGSITSVSGAIGFGNENLTTTGTLAAGDTSVTKLTSDNLILDGNTLSVLPADTNGSINLVANGTGIIDLQSPLQTLGQTVTGTVGITGQLNIDNLRLDGNVLSSIAGNITLTAAGFVETSTTFQPAADGTLDLGTTLKRFNSLFLDNSISDGTNSIAMATLLSLRNVTVGDGPGMVSGMSLFWDGTKWVASLPDTEVDHTAISGLLDGAAGDGGHSQFAMLTGRAGGQTIQGGTAASQNLNLESTAHATKGYVLTKDIFAPFTNASFAVTWSGTDLGDATHYFRDVYTKGQHIGFRLENLGAPPAFSAANVGRLIYNTATQQVMVDRGTDVVAVGSGGGGGGGFGWEVIDSGGMTKRLLASGLSIYDATDQETSEIVARIKIPSSYNAGTQIFLKNGAVFSPTNTGNFLFRSISYIFRAGINGSTTPTGRTSTNAQQAINGTANFISTVSNLDITDASGQINGVAVAPGDTISVRLQRLPGTETSGVADIVSLLAESFEPVMS